MATKKKKKTDLQTKIIVFYTAFFIWLTTIIFLKPEESFISYFTGAMALFYFVFLREAGDIFWFILGVALIYLAAIVTIDGLNVTYNVDAVNVVPLWLPAAWGTTLVALRRFYNMVNVAKS